VAVTTPCDGTKPVVGGGAGATAAPGELEWYSKTCPATGRVEMDEGEKV